MRLLLVLTALSMAAVFATTMTLVPCLPVVAAECAGADCGKSGCRDAQQAGSCTHCGTLGKMFAATNSHGLLTRTATPMHLFTPLLVMPEGYSPSIDQPPRAA